MAYTMISGSPAVLRDDGATIPADPGNRDYQAYLAWLGAGNTVTPYAPVVAIVTVMSPLVFMARFTDAEQAAVATAAQTNASIMLWLVRCAGATYVDVADAQTVSGVSALSSAGLIAAARVHPILAPL